LSGTELSVKATPNQGIRRSTRSWLIVGLVFGLLFGLLFGLVSGLEGRLEGGLVFGPVFGLLVGLFVGLDYGGRAVLQHYSLRWLLARNGSLPLRLVPFLDFCVERILLRRVGGGYIFLHRLLMDHFAALEQSTSHGEDSTHANT
jgi:hypothetical protein